MAMLPVVRCVASLALLCNPIFSANAFSSGKSRLSFLQKYVSSSSSAREDTQMSASLASVQEVKTDPIPGMKPGTSGLRKKVEVWQGLDSATSYKNYVENFIQALLDTATSKNNGDVPHT